MVEHNDAESGALRNTALADALQTQDVAAVAFALRHGPTVVPVAPATGGDGVDDLWTYRDPATGQAALLLFSDIAHKPASLPETVTLLSPPVLRAYLGVHGDELATVYFDIVGPHPMQASPDDIIAALDA